jgi:hypothetical protein
LSPYCKTHGACSRRAHQKGTHARIIPSRASSLGGPCPRLYHCHTHVQSFGFGAVVSHSPLSFCIGVRRGRPGTFLAGRHSTLSASTSSPARAHYQAFPSQTLRPIASSIECPPHACSAGRERRAYPPFSPAHRPASVPYLGRLCQSRQQGRPPSVTDPKTTQCDPTSRESNPTPCSYSKVPGPWSLLRC